ncbi:BURP domain-containing protein [Musa troglodytarum]|uniref:BURP domain-containing protein n=1 Tax=Musa troglodytarum TaxID=320322 RepID=A0A9E7JM74_9LILI|nr:BURP domain-containing protein [Musa troglodytarum]
MSCTVRVLLEIEALDPSLLPRRGSTPFYVNHGERCRPPKAAVTESLAVESHAALPPQLVYWNSVVPNTPMPSAISDLINPGTNVSVGMGGVNASSKGDSGGATVKVGEGGVHVGTWVPFSGGLSFSYAAAETQIHDDPSVALLFLEKGLKPGSKMSVQFKKTTTGAAFLPRKEAESIRFSSAKHPEILNYYGVNPGSAEALVMEKTVQECENLAERGKVKFCATSLESMVELSRSSLGTRDVTAVSTAISKAGSTLQLYTITEGSRCPATDWVGLVGADSAVAEAVAVCHTNTKAWNPNHVAFKVKPGSVPVWHFLPENHVGWSRST